VAGVRGTSNNLTTSALQHIFYDNKIKENTRGGTCRTRVEIYKCMEYVKKSEGNFTWETFAQVVA
jgi:hypothetical protein